MCFQWMRRIYQYFRRRCSRQNRGYSNEISSHHRGSSNIEGHGSFFCGGEGSITYSREAASFQPMPTSSSYSIEGEYTCGGDGSVVITSGDSRGTSDWGTGGRTGPVYSTRGDIRGSGDISVRRVSVYGYDAPLSAGAGGGGPGYYSGGMGCDVRGYSGPQFSSGGGESSQAMQQKCPVIIPNVEDQQCKKSSHWPPRQKK
ncbi:uncharacterized protein LOC104056841 [Cuculus canorus]|uniref:uncharacterized protein LOC104056841 n=1 Tax=Cuculus canorus TaxID=55661 RepID=UPI0023AA47A6|nr:uncharacterized protein LOC104056841 [Cuculus canorus]